LKNCRENTSAIKVGQAKLVRYMKTNIHVWSYLAPF